MGGLHDSHLYIMGFAGSTPLTMDRGWCHWHRPANRLPVRQADHDWGCIVMTVEPACNANGENVGLIENCTT